MVCGKPLKPRALRQKGKNMEISIYAKKRSTKEGKAFFSYITRLTKKDGTEVSAAVKFRDTCTAPRPEDCPCNIIVEKDSCNFSSKTITLESTGERIASSTLWVSAYAKGSPFVDHSMDEFF